jgi:hypothetical protein
MRAVAFLDGAFSGWRVDFDEETGKTIIGWLGPRDNARAFLDNDGTLAVRLC